jgi:hypothetical protein
MVKAILWIWQLPQNLLGLLVIRILKADRMDQAEAAFSKHAPRVYGFERAGWGKVISGVSLGKYIIVFKQASSTVIAHEYGHCRQSILLGPLYLLLIGVPSCLFNNVWDRLLHKKWPNERRVAWYYSRYPEAWADKLGGVTRERGDQNG